MKAEIRNAFEKIKADDALISKTENYLKKAIATQPEKRSASRRKGSLAALYVCAAAICLFLGLSSWLIYFTAEAYISVDVNPSIELVLNRFDRVINARAYNADGETLLKNTRVYGEKSNNALEKLMTEMERGGLITQDGLVSVTVRTADIRREESLCQTLRGAVEERLKSLADKPQVEVFPVTQDIQEHAHSHNMTPARYLAILELMEVDKTATIEEYGDSSIGQIRQRERECRQGHGNDGYVQDNEYPVDNSTERHGHRGGHGHGHR